MRVTPAMESEKTLLGALLLDPHLYSAIERKICPNDFFNRDHQFIFDTMFKLRGKHGTFDAPMIVDEMGLQGKDVDYLYMLANECPSTANIVAHCDIIREKSVQRQLMECSAQIKQAELEECESEHSCNDCRLATFFIELGHEINSAELTEEYLRQTIVEVNKALVHTLAALEEEGEE